jgi:hypothetical protein
MRCYSDELAELTALARRLLRRAAVRLCTMPLATALSSARAASRCWTTAASTSPVAIALRTFFVDVLRAVRTVLLRSPRLAFWRFRLICDLMFAMGAGSLPVAFAEPAPSIPSRTAP